MDRLTLKQLRYFCAVMDTGHLGRAAELCAVSQPAMSVQIKEMEAQFGHPLFERGPKGVRPTGFAEDLLPRVRNILSSVDGLSDLAPLRAGGAPHRWRLGVIPTIAPYVVPRIVSGLSAQFPQMDLQIMEAMTPKLLQSLEQGRVDSALLALPAGGSEMSAVSLFHEPFVLVRPEAQRDAPVPPAHILARERLLLLEEGHCFRDQALEFCSLQSAQLRPGLDASNLSTLVQMVAAGLGVTLIPEMALPVELRGTPVACSRFPNPQPQREVGIIWRKTNPLGSAYLVLAHAVGQAIQGNAPTGAL